MRRVYISDIHISLSDPYCWLSQPECQRLASFLTSKELIDSCDQVFFVGDVVDLWAYPNDMRPPTFAEIMAKAHNKPIVDAINNLAAKGKGLAYMVGNHDMQVTKDEVRSVFPNMTLFRNSFRENTLHVEHGHEKCLFNGPDPRPGVLPFGYYITRITTTGEARNGTGVSLNLWTILRSANKVLSLATNQRTLGEAVFDVCIRETGVKLNESIVHSDGSVIQVGDVRDMFSDCFNRWNAAGRNDAREAVLCEWDPFYGLPDDGHIKMAIAGHSHDHIFSYRKSDQSLYMNTGSWCGADSNFARTWTEDDILWGGLFEWDGNATRKINKAGVQAHA